MHYIKSAFGFGGGNDENKTAFGSDDILNTNVNTNQFQKGGSSSSNSPPPISNHTKKIVKALYPLGIFDQNYNGAGSSSYHGGGSSSSHGGGSSGCYPAYNVIPGSEASQRGRLSSNSNLSRENSNSNVSNDLGSPARIVEGRASSLSTCSSLGGREAYKTLISRITADNPDYLQAGFSKIVDCKELSSLVWNGVPFEWAEIRAYSWRVLLGIAPNARDRHLSTLQRKRQEYHAMVRSQNEGQKHEEKLLVTQIQKDLPRTNCGSLQKLLQTPQIHDLMERVLYSWAIRHPACGYVQGINDLLTPFLAVFLAEKQFVLGSDHFDGSAVGGGSSTGPGTGNSTASSTPANSTKNASQRANNSTSNANVTCNPTVLSNQKTTKEIIMGDLDSLADSLNIEDIPKEMLDEVEADSFMCLTKLLDTIQDHYTPNQPGIQRIVRSLWDCLKSLRPQLHKHFEDNGLDMIQVSFRWFNCLFSREFPIKCVVRLFDTYISELHDRPLEFGEFLIFFGLGFLLQFEKDLPKMDFQDLILFLQSPPTDHYSPEQAEIILSRTYMLQQAERQTSRHRLRMQTFSSS